MSASVLSFDGGQLDLFAEAEAAVQERRIDAAPTLFDTEQRGYFIRVAAADQWAAVHGHFDCRRRSHAWHSTSMRLQDDRPTATCRPAVLTAALQCDHYDGGCQCVGDTVYRGACLRCTWEGLLRDLENPAAEDRPRPRLARLAGPAAGASSPPECDWQHADLSGAHPLGRPRQRHLPDRLARLRWPHLNQPRCPRAPPRSQPHRIRRIRPLRPDRRRRPAPMIARA
jgi:hypothetical protein